ncbi:MAG: phosphatidylserine decarboxylase proenzyme [Rhodothalassiaceae bacterium]|nr:MAG: phosphatidylserine decarboxylase proenzyme [Rhodothalassiaceae bacterium]
MAKIDKSAPWQPPRLHPEGHPFVLTAAALSVLSFWLISDALGWLLLALALACAFFFRHPRRTTPLVEDALVSAADGVVTHVTREEPPEELEMEGERWRISVFLSVLDVHVNRVPADGVVRRRIHIRGRFLNAMREEAAAANERTLVRVEGAHGDYGFAQIAGLIARRIVCPLEEGDRVSAGEPFGIIRFGSRLDIWCPPGFHPWVAVGQRVVGGETIVAAARPLVAGGAVPETRAS